MPRNRKRGTGSSAASQVPRSKAGCWTCRIRRKRCDEQPDETGNCQACKRLDIECLGWGSRRPDWCRDKDALTAYKLNLKKKLCSRAGTRPSAKSRAAAAARGGQEGAIPSTSSHSLTLPDLDLDLDEDADGFGIGIGDEGKAPSGESPRGSSLSVEEDLDLETDDFDFYYSRHHRTNSNITNTTNTTSTTGFEAFSSPGSSFSPAFSPPSPLSALFSPHPHPTALLSPITPLGSLPTHQTAKTQTQLMSSLTARLRQLLPLLSVPQQYALLTSQILDLHDFSATHAHVHSHGGADHEVKVAQQARAIENELNRLTHRASFDGLLCNAIGLGGLGFDFTAPSTTSYLSPTSAVPNVHAGVGVDGVYGSPMAMWSPDLISDSMSTFSGGSSVPTSPAMSGAINNNGNTNGTSLGDLFGFDTGAAATVTNDPWFTSMNMSMGGLDLGLNFGALGLSNDVSFGSYDNAFGLDTTVTVAPATTNTPSIALYPPSNEPSPSKAAPLSNTNSASSANVNATPTSTTLDPFQIHHETCTLLLQAVLSPPAPAPSTLFDTHFNNFTDFTTPTTNAAPLEDSLQRMTSKFSSVFPTQRAIPSEYLFAATVAGALSSTVDRRAYFKRVVDSIEGRLGTNVCAVTLNEAWA